MEARAFSQNEVFEAATQFAHTQGFIPGPEPAHAIKAVIDEAIEAREAGEERVILFNLSGHGFFDMQAYDDYLNHRLPEVEYRDEQLDKGLASVPDVPIPG
jgi:tryptophan synthase beta chain